MQGPHARPIVMVKTPIIFLAFESLDEGGFFFTVCIFGRFSLPHPFVAGFLLLFLSFLGRRFLGGLFLAGWFALSFLVAVPRHSFFKEFISAIMATIFSCSSVGLPHAFSSSNSLASYLFPAWTIRSSAVKVAHPSPH